MINEDELIRKTHYGLGIYSHILRLYYPGEIVISLSGRKCNPAKNPFRGHRLTLNIYQEGNRRFLFNDLEDDTFSGDPFDFAKLHYKIGRDELLVRLNEEMYLHLEEDYNFYSGKDRNQEFSFSGHPKLKAPYFSFFKHPVTNTVPFKEISLAEVYLDIQSPGYKPVTQELRSYRDKYMARKFKAEKFDYVTFSGTFSKRADSALIEHSGLMTIDFDHIKNVPRLKKALLHDEYFETQLLFISPSGNGLKWIVSIDISEYTHQQWFLAISSYIRKTYHLEIDKSGKDVSRACFLPYDPEVYINPGYLSETYLYYQKKRNNETI